jgi:hypothetical protein
MLLIRRKSFGFLVAGVLALTSARFARAQTAYTIDSGSTIFAQDSVDGVVGFDSADATSGEALAATPSGPAYATTSLSQTDLQEIGYSDSLLNIIGETARGGSSTDYSQSQFGILFTPAQNMDYSIVNSYGDLGADPPSEVTDNLFLTQGSSSLFSGQITNTESTSIDLNSNLPFTGSVTGVLQAGVQYDFSGSTNIRVPPGGGGTATYLGISSLVFSPISAPTFLSSSGHYQFVSVPFAPIVAGGGPSVPNPGVDVSLNPQPLPPFPDPGATVDMTNPGSPVYTNPAVASSYELDFGMNAGGAVSFTVPNPSDPNNFAFTGTGPTGDPYTVSIQIGGGVVDPGSFVELNPQPLPPFPDPGYSYVAFDFSFETAADPTVTFQVSSGGTDFLFAPVPEPASLSVLGLGGLALLGRRRAVQTAGPY